MEKNLLPIFLVKKYDFFFQYVNFEKDFINFLEKKI